MGKVTGKVKRGKKRPPEDDQSLRELHERLERARFIEPRSEGREQYEAQLADLREQLAPVREFIEQKREATKKPRAKKSPSKKIPNNRERIFLQCLELEG